MPKHKLTKPKHSTQVFDKTRRTFIKGVAYVSALSTGGLSSIALANNEQNASKQKAESMNDGIKIIQETLFDRETVTLVNQSNELQILNARQPISLHQVTGILVVTVNQSETDAVDGIFTMSPNERITFDIKAIGLEVTDAGTELPILTNLAENQLQISSMHSGFNSIVPVQLA